MLKRTLFYSIEPLGIGTLQVEGLRSYVMRLAAAHNIPPRALLSVLLTRYPFDSDLKASPSEVMRALVNCGSGRTIAEVTKRLELATGQRLDACTLERFVGLLSPLGLSQLQDPKFCPVCVQQDPRCHGHLAWDVGYVEVCPTHNVQLQSVKNCGAPAEKHLVLQHRPFLPSVCNLCGAIGFKCQSYTTSPSTAQQAWTAAAVGGALMMSTENHRNYTPATIIASLQTMVDTAYGGSSVRASLAAGLSRASVGQWLLGRIRPSLVGLLRLCQDANCELSGMLQGKFRVVACERVPLDTLTTRHYRVSPVSTDVLQSRLDMAIKAHPAPTLEEFARLNSTNSRWLRRRFPIESRKLTAMSKERREMERAQAYSQTLDSYKSAAKKLLSSGKRVSPKYVEKLSGLAAFSSNLKRRRALLEALAAVEKDQH